MSQLTAPMVDFSVVDDRDFKLNPNDRRLVAGARIVCTGHSFTFDEGPAVPYYRYVLPDGTVYDETFINRLRLVLRRPDGQLELVE